MKKVISVILSSVIICLTFSILPISTIAALSSNDFVEWDNKFISNGVFNDSIDGFPQNYCFDIKNMDKYNKTLYFILVKKEIFAAAKNANVTLNLMDVKKNIYSFNPSDINDIAPEDYDDEVIIGGWERNKSSYATVMKSVSLISYQADECVMDKNFAVFEVYSAAEVASDCTISVPVNLKASGDTEENINLYNKALEDNAYVYQYSSLKLQPRTTQYAKAGTSPYISFHKSEEGSMQVLIADKPLRDEEENMEDGKWRDNFVVNGQFNELAKGFPSNYVFDLVTDSYHRSQMTNQNNIKEYKIKKEFLAAIQSCGKTVTVMDDCASYIIGPENFINGVTINPSEYNDTVSFGSYFRTGTSYAPVAVNFANDRGLIKYDDQYIMGKQYSFWQYNYFPNQILSGCNVQLRVTNAGVVSDSSITRDFDGIANRFYNYATNNQLYMIQYYKGVFSVKDKPDNNSFLMPTAVQDSDKVEFYLRSNTGYTSRTYLLTSINPNVIEVNTNTAKTVQDKISLIPVCASTQQKGLINQIRAKYNTLNESQKALIANDYVFFASEIEMMIDSIGDDAYASKDLIFKTNEAYKALSDKSKAEVSNYDELNKKYNQLESTIKVACVGDSITKGSHASNLLLNSYPGRLQKMLGSDYEVKNFGVGGRTVTKTTPDTYWEQDLYRDSLSYNPDIVIIMMGSNDTKAKYWNDSVINGKENYSNDLKDLIASYQQLESNPKIYIATSPTVTDTIVGITNEAVTNELVPLQKEVARESGLELIDINSATADHPTNFTDGVHCTDIGYNFIALNILKGMGKTCQQTETVAKNKIAATLKTPGQTGDIYSTLTGEKLYDNQKLYAFADLDGNDKIDVRDLIRLKKKVSNSTTQISMGSGDMNYDEETNSEDLIILKKTLLGSDIDIFF